MGSINENTTTEEILSEIRYAFESKEFEKFKGILVRREEDLKNALNKSKQEFKLLKEKHDLLDKNFCTSEIEKLDLEEELEKQKTEFDLLKKKRSLSESKKQISEQNSKKPKIQIDEKSTEEMIVELTRENEKLKEEIELYGKKFPEHVNRVFKLEEWLADLLEKNASNFKADVFDDDQSPGNSTSSRIRISRNSAEIQNSHLQQKEGGDTMMHNSASDLQKGINEPSNEAIILGAAAAAAAGSDVEVYVRKQRVSPSTAPVDRAEPHVIFIKSESNSDDDVSITDSFMEDFVKKV